MTFEHIVQDAGTGPELKAWAAGQSFLKLYVEKDAGMYDAVNRGLQRATGPIVAYLNCDEQYLPGALRKVLSYFSVHPEIEVVFGDAILIDADGTPLSYRRTTLPSLAHLRLADLNTLTCATFFRRRLVSAGHLFPTHLKIAGDQYWTFKLLKAGVKMGVLREPLSVFAFTGSNLSHSRRARAEKFGWLPKDEKPNRWLTPLIVSWHRFRKLLGGAYRLRNVTVEIYTRDQPDQRSVISSLGVGFRWPKTRLPVR